MGAGFGPVSSHRDLEHHREPQHQDQPRTQQRTNLENDRHPLRGEPNNSKAVVYGITPLAVTVDCDKGVTAPPHP